LEEVRTRREQNGWEYGRLHRPSAAFSLALALLVTAFLFGVLLQGTQVADEGMAPTLRAGDVLLFSRYSKYIRSPRRGDIYLMERAGAAQLGRVVGLSGERVAIVGGNVYIDGVFLSEAAYALHAPADMEEIELGENEYFLLPDDRVHMLLDPAAMRVGIDDMRARAFMRVAPFGDMGFFA